MQAELMSVCENPPLRSWELPDEGKKDLRGISRAQSVLERGVSTAEMLRPQPPTWHRDLSASAPAQQSLPTGGCALCCCRSPACCADTAAHLGTKGTREHPPLPAITQGVLWTVRPLIHLGSAAGVFYSPTPSVFTD